MNRESRDSRQQSTEDKPHDEARLHHSTSADNSCEFTAQQGRLAHRQHVQGSRKHGIMIFLQKNFGGVGHIICPKFSLGIEEGCRHSFPCSFPHLLTCQMPFLRNTRIGGCYSYVTNSSHRNLESNSKSTGST